MYHAGHQDLWAVSANVSKYFVLFATHILFTNTAFSHGSLCTTMSTEYI